VSEEIGRRIEDAAAARSREAASRVDRSQLADFIVAGATRRRRVRAFATGAFAVVAVLAVGGGTVAAMSAWGPDSVAPATQSATPTASATVDASDAPSPSPTVTGPAADTGLDGIADYPALAPARGEGFPTAYVMEDWVWDHVGPGWSLESYSMGWDPYSDPSPEIPKAVVYLVSPDSATFELVTLDRAHSTGLRVVSWREDERTAVAWWEGDGDSADGAAELNLQTGVLDPLDFTMPGKVHSTSESLVAVAADGAELWTAWAPDAGLRFYRWSHADGYTAAAANNLPEAGTATGFALIRPYLPTKPQFARDDGAAVALARFPPGGEMYNGDPPAELAVYDLARDVVTRTQVTGDLTSRFFSGWSSSDTFQYSPLDGDLDLAVDVAVAGAPQLGSVPTAISEAPRGQTGQSAVVGFGEATAVGILSRDCGC